MAITQAQLATAITAGQLQFNLQNVIPGSTGTALPPVGALPLSYGVPLQMDGEITYCVSQPVLNTIVVRTRGADGTFAAPHDILTNVYMSSVPGDFPLPYPGTLTSLDLSQDLPVTIGQSSTITVQNSNTVFNINALSAAAILLNAPTLPMNGTAVEFVSMTNFAHVITAAVTGGFRDGSGVSRNTATFSVSNGGSIKFIAENGLWISGETPLNVTLA